MDNIISLQPHVVTAPDFIHPLSKHKVFLAGGITNCPDWQSQFINLLTGLQESIILNPRRSHFPINDQSISLEQIRWEFDNLKTANVIVVWFSKGSINPIVLYELGIWVNARPEIPAFIGIDPGYIRADDVVIQTKLARPEIKICDSLQVLAKQVRQFLEHQQH